MTKGTLEHREVYANHADRYELLVSREDYESNIPRKLKQLVTFSPMTRAALAKRGLS